MGNCICEVYQHAGKGWGGGVIEGMHHTFLNLQCEIGRYGTRNGKMGGGRWGTVLM